MATPTGEAASCEVLLAEVALLEPGDGSWVAKLTVITENVAHHAEEEESEMFPKLCSATTAGERDEVGAQLDARKGQLGAPVLSGLTPATATATPSLLIRAAVFDRQVASPHRDPIHSGLYGGRASSRQPR